MTLRFLGREEEAYAAYYKAAWNQAWQGAAYHSLAELDCRRENWTTALDHLDRSLRLNTDNLRARNLRALVLGKLGRKAEAEAQLRATIALDPLDWWARHLAGEPLQCDTQARLDIALDFARSGFDREALAVLKDCKADAGTAPLAGYYKGWLHARLGETKKAAAAYRAAASASPDYCFPSRVEEIMILEAAICANPADSRAPYYLGNMFYDRKRHAEAIRLWEKSAKLNPNYSVVWRNLGIGYFNITRQPARARAAYDRAFLSNPLDARLLYERDQLWKRLGEKPKRRLRELEKHPGLVRQRDDLSVELCALYNQTGRPSEALKIVSTRKFQPWEGGEGQALGQHVRTHLALGQAALARKDAKCAHAHFEQALASPENLSEAKHLLANQSDVHYWLGVALLQLGDKAGAQRHWSVSAEFRGDFQEMSVLAFSEMTYYSALSLQRLEKKAPAQKLLRGLLAYARQLAKAEAKVDYFATSLPAMLLFDDDPQYRQDTIALFLEAQAWLGLGDKAKANVLLRKVLRREPNHAPASDLSR